MDWAGGINSNQIISSGLETKAGGNDSERHSCSSSA